MVLYLSVLMGVMLYLAFSLNEAIKLPDFEWSIYWKDNLPVTAINLICGFVIIWHKEDIQNWFPITGIIAVYIGFAGQNLIKRFFKVFDGRIDTFIGK